LSAELQELESRIARAWMPRGMSDVAYTLKLHVRYVRDLLQSAAMNQAAQPERADAGS
jgi:hypothetical protein